MRSGLARQIGLGFRPELAADLLRQRDAVEFVEIVAETCFAQKSTRSEAMAVREIWPVVPHGVKLSLGSADGIEEGRVERLARLARELRAPAVSEHIAMTRGRDREIGHLTQLPRTREAVRVVARNVAHARRRLPDVPLLLENVAWSFLWPEDDMNEESFIGEVVRVTGCDLLLDVGNLYANAVNEGRDPRAVLAAYPLEHVGMLHVAGGIFEYGFYFDTHAHPVSAAVLDLVGDVLRARPDVPVLIERDASFGPFGELCSELDAIRRLRPAHREEARAARARSASCAPPEDASAFADRQRAVACLLTDRDPPAGRLAESLGPRALDRARGILLRKRVDDALPLLGRLGPRIGEFRALAEQVMNDTERAPRGAGPRDALRIAEAASEVPALRDDARVDALLLRARFRAPDARGCVAPRVLPFVGENTSSDGLRLRVAKGFGAFAPLRTRERKVRRWQTDSKVSPRQ